MPFWFLVYHQLYVITPLLPENVKNKEMHWKICKENTRTHTIQLKVKCGKWFGGNAKFADTTLYFLKPSSVLAILEFCFCFICCCAAVVVVSAKVAFKCRCVITENIFAIVCNRKDLLLQEKHSVICENNKKGHTNLKIATFAFTNNIFARKFSNLDI